MKLLWADPTSLSGAGLALPETIANGKERSEPVKVLCAWCVRDGRPAFLREKWPFEDPSETHGLCHDHFTSLSARVNQVVRPKVWFLWRVHDAYWKLTRWVQQRGGRFFSLC